MSVPLLSEPVAASTQRPSLRPQPRARRSSKRARVPAISVVQALPKAKRPLWLKLLVGMQTLSSSLALGMVGATLMVYGLTVQADRRLNATTATLQQLQRQEQQLIAAKAVLQHHLAQDAVDSEVDALPENVIFLDPEIAPTPSKQPATTISPPTPTRSIPMGY
jgi:hypothetical protein